jgi:SAM-dependent methyltransferase
MAINMAKKVFDKYAAYYNLLYQDKDYKSEVDYVESLLLKHSDFQAKSILDVGCGTGKHANLFAEKSYQVTGIDLSSKMIKEAKKLENENLNFKVADATNFQLYKKFDAIVSLFHVASYQTDNEKLFSFFKQIFSHLESNGVFIFDFWYGAAVLLDKPVVRVKRFENKNLRITRIAEPSIDFKKNTVDVNYEIIIEDIESCTTHKIYEKHVMRYLFIPELEFLLKKVGFEVLSIREWLNHEDSIHSSSWNGVCIVRKI